MAFRLRAVARRAIASICYLAWLTLGCAAESSRTPLVTAVLTLLSTLGRERPAMAKQAVLMRRPKAATRCRWGSRATTRPVRTIAVRPVR